MTQATFVQDGLAIDHMPAAAILAGDIVIMGDLIGVAKSAITVAEGGALAITGAFDLIKDGTTGPVFGANEPVHWDYVQKLAVRTAGPNTVHFGSCIAAAGPNDATVRTLLQQRPLPAVMEDRLWEDIDISGGSKTLDIQDVGKVLNVTVGDATNVVTLPAAAAGLEFVIRCGTDGQQVAISPNPVTS